jgi:hypothetical protein
MAWSEVQVNAETYYVLKTEKQKTERPNERLNPVLSIGRINKNALHLLYENSHIITFDTGNFYFKENSQVGPALRIRENLAFPADELGSRCEGYICTRSDLEKGKVISQSRLENLLINFKGDMFAIKEQR